MQQITNGDLNINVANHQNIDAPNTGLGLMVNDLGSVGCIIIAAALISLFIVIAFFCLHKKFRSWRFFFAILLPLIAITTALSVPTIATTKAEKNAINTTNLNIDLRPGEISTATASTTIDIDAIDCAYMIYAYIENDNVLHNTFDPNIVINPTLPTASDNPNSLSLNSYGIKTDITGNFTTLSTDASKPTLIYASDEPTTGSVLNITYAAKLDSTMLGGSYTNIGSSNHIKYVAEPQHQFTLTYESDEKYSSHIPISVSYGPAPALEYKFTIPSDEENVPTLWGKAFTGWCDGTIVSENTCDGTVYQPGEEITLKVDSAVEINTATTLHAMWKYVAITYDENEGIDPPQPTSMQEGATLPYTFEVTGGYPSRLGYDFDSWNTEADGTGTRYVAGDKITTDTSIELYAIWTPVVRTITYRSYDGIITYGTQTFTYDSAQNIRAYNAESGWNIKPEAPASKAFAGWTTTQGSTAVDYTDKQVISTLVDNKTVYAVWK